MLGKLGRLADDSKFLAVLHCKGMHALNEHSKHTYLQTYNELVCGDFLADSLITPRTTMTFQTYIATLNL